MEGSQGSRRAKQDPDTQQNLAYWMGRVDATLNKVEVAIDGMVKKDEGRWQEFDSWRRRVDERLQGGSSKFEDHARRLLELENCCDEVTNGNGNGKQEKAPEKAKFGSWEWFRDSYLEKGIYIILSLALYKVIEIVVTYWANNP